MTKEHATTDTSDSNIDKLRSLFFPLLPNAKTIMKWLRLFINFRTSVELHLRTILVLPKDDLKVLLKFMTLASCREVEVITEDYHFGTQLFENLTTKAVSPEECRRHIKTTTLLPIIKEELDMENEIRYYLNQIKAGYD